MQTIYGKQTSDLSTASRWLTANAPHVTDGRPRLADQTSARMGVATVAAKAIPKGAAHADRTLIEALTHSSVYRKYEQAFTDATGLPLALRPAESWQLPLHGKQHESPFCALMAQSSRTCSSCLQMQEKLSQASSNAPQTMMCSSGLCETSVPV